MIPKLPLPELPDRTLVKRLNEQSADTDFYRFGSSLRVSIQEINDENMPFLTRISNLQLIILQASQINPDASTLNYLTNLKQCSQKSIDVMLRMLSAYTMQDISSDVKWQPATGKIAHIWNQGASTLYEGVDFFDILTDDLARLSELTYRCKAHNFAKAISLYRWMIDAGEIYTYVALNRMAKLETANFKSFDKRYYQESIRVLFGTMNTISDSYKSSFAAIPPGLKMDYPNNEKVPLFISTDKICTWWSSKSYATRIEDERQNRMRPLLEMIKLADAHIVDGKELSLEYKVKF
jgi:hypothetical protein